MHVRSLRHALAVVSAAGALFWVLPAAACGTTVAFFGQSPGQAPPPRDLSDRVAAYASEPVTLIGNEALGIPPGVVVRHRAQENKEPASTAAPAWLLVEEWMHALGTRLSTDLTELRRRVEFDD